MKDIVFIVVVFLVGVVIAGAGIYYLIKEKNDKESRKIYGIAALVGIAVIIGALVKILVM